MGRLPDPQAMLKYLRGMDRDRKPRRFPPGQILVLFLIGLTAFLLLLPGITGVDWVGTRFVEFDFQVIDQDTQEPVPDAILHLREEGEREDTQQIRTGRDGRARLVQECLSSGRSGIWNPTWSVMPPSWLFRVSAEGYRPTEFVWIGSYRHQMRDRDHGSVLPVRVELRKRPPQPPG